MDTVIGINALKDKWREAKVRAGVMRGLSHRSRFDIAARIGIPAMQVAFDTVAPKEGKIEIEASMYSWDNATEKYIDCGSVYTLEDLLNDVRDVDAVEIQLIKVAWNKRGTDANRNNILEPFLYKPA